MEVVAVPSIPKQSHLYTSADEVINSLLDLQLEKWGLPAFQDCELFSTSNLYIYISIFILFNSLNCIFQSLKELYRLNLGVLVEQWSKDMDVDQRCLESLQVFFLVALTKFITVFFAFSFSNHHLCLRNT